MHWGIMCAPRGKYNVMLSCACESAWHIFNWCASKDFAYVYPEGKDVCVARVRSVGSWAFCSSDTFLPPGLYSPHPPRLCKYSRGLGRNGITHRIGRVAVVAAGISESQLPRGVRRQSKRSAARREVHGTAGQGGRRQWMPQATNVAAEAAKEQYVQLLKNCGVAPRCSNTPLSLVPHTDDAITSKLFGVPDECLSLIKSLEKLAPAFWAFEFSDLSTCLVQVMAICLAQGCMFRDQTMNSRMADGQGVRIPQNLTCTLPRMIYSASRPLREPPGTVKTALNCARDVAETFTELALSNQGLIGHSVSNAFAAQVEEVCENALTVNRFHDDPSPLQPSTHTIEFADIETGSLDYIQCNSLCRPHERVRKWAHNTGPCKHADSVEDTSWATSDNRNAPRIIVHGRVISGPMSTP